MMVDNTVCGWRGPPEHKSVFNKLRTSPWDCLQDKGGDAGWGSGCFAVLGNKEHRMGKVSQGEGHNCGMGYLEDSRAYNWFLCK